MSSKTDIYLFAIALIILPIGIKVLFFFYGDVKVAIYGVTDGYEQYLPAAFLPVLLFAYRDYQKKSYGYEKWMLVHAIVISFAGLALFGIVEVCTRGIFQWCTSLKM